MSMAVHFRSTKLVRRNLVAAVAVAIVRAEAGVIPEDAQGVEAEAAAGATNAPRQPRIRPSGDVQIHCVVRRIFGDS